MISHLGVVYVSRHSDVNLVEIAKDFVKEDDKALLIEDGGGLQSASPRAKGPTTHSPLIRFHYLFRNNHCPFFFLCLYAGFYAGLSSWMSRSWLRTG